MQRGLVKIICKEKRAGPVKNIKAKVSLEKEPVKEFVAGLANDGNKCFVNAGMAIFPC